MPDVRSNVGMAFENSLNFSNGNTMLSKFLAVSRSQSNPSINIILLYICIYKSKGNFVFTVCPA